MDCIFCKLANGQIPTELLYEDEHVVALNDAGPQAPLHVLFMPKKHVRRLSELADHQVLIALIDAVKHYCKQAELEEDGYRLVINTGPQGGQSVDHLHLHLLAKRNLGWPPG